MIDSVSSTAMSGLWTKPDPQKPAAASEDDATAPAASGPAVAPRPEGAVQAQTDAQGGGQSDGQSGGDGEEPSFLDRILEVGFRAYAEEIRQEKLQELREKILESMGLTEEDLQKMPPEERASVEKLIANEMAKRMAAQAELNGGKDGAQTTQVAYMHSHTTTVTATEVRVGAMSAPVPGTLLDPGAGGMGLGPLLALQEQEAAQEAAEAATVRPVAQGGKNDRVEA